MPTRNGHTFHQAYWDLHDAMLGRRPASLREKYVVLGAIYDDSHISNGKEKVHTLEQEEPHNRILEILDLTYKALGPESFNLKIQSWIRDVATDMALRGVTK